MTWYGENGKISDSHYEPPRTRISVVAPVRARIALVDQMLDSVWTMAADPDRVEVVLRCDDDDAAMITHLTSRTPDSWRTPVLVIGPHRTGYATLPAFINEAAHRSRGDLVIVVNDDAEFQTKGWDILLAERAASIPDGLFNFGIETANAGNFIFPCVSRTLINLLGFVFDERLVYPDIWLRDVLMPFGRAIRVPEVVVAHHWQGMSPDQQQAVAEVQSYAYQSLYFQCVDEGRKLVSDALGRLRMAASA